MLVATHQPTKQQFGHTAHCTGGCTAQSGNNSSQCFHKEIMMAMIIVVYQLFTDGAFPPDGSNADAKKQRKY